jgi:hypothetical protein
MSHFSNSFCKCHLTCIVRWCGCNSLGMACLQSIFSSVTLNKGIKQKTTPWYLHYFSLGFAFHTLPVMINWWKKQNDFVKIKFHLNENIEWHCMQLALNWIYVNWIEFKCIEFKFYLIKFEYSIKQLLQKVLNFFLWVCCWKEK